MFSANQNPFQERKDTVRNVEETGKFCWSLATWPLRDAVNASAEFLPPAVDEFARAGLKKQYSKVLEGTPVPFVEESPVKFECEYHSTLRLPANPPAGTVDVIIGKVVAVHIDDNAMTDGRLDVRKTQPIARCGYYEYAVVRETFEMVIPGMNEATLAGLEGSMKRSRKLLTEHGVTEEETT
jgi:flavin reductase (DIM6/NTAB) family NADH-FMN oxidoreductase RutF